jgi:hypothetical protein
VPRTKAQLIRNAFIGGNGMKRFSMTMVTFATLVCGQLALAGPLDPDCTAEKAAKSAATKATIGVGGRCSPAEAAKDTAKGAFGDGDKDRKDKKHDDDDDDHDKHDRDDD